ncbi:MAG TPA: hypothetical protein PLZ84_00065, partial [Clostridia bacterium]|nr:hypothetical protein [Clostridia bacterium]
MRPSKELTMSIVFIMLYPFVVAACGLFALSPLGVLIPALFAFLLIKVGDGVFRFMTAALSYILTVFITSVLLNGIIPDYLLALGAGFIIISLYFAAGYAYYWSNKAGKGFWVSVGASGGVFLGGCILLLAIMYFVFDRDVISSAVSIFTNRFSSEFVLSIARQVIAIDKLMYSTEGDFVAILDQIAKLTPDQCIKLFTDIAENLLRTYLGGLLISFSMLLGLLTAWFTALFSKIKAFAPMAKSPLRWKISTPDTVPPYALVFPKRVISSVLLSMVVVWLMSIMGMLDSGVYFATLAIIAIFLFSLIGI